MHSNILNNIFLQKSQVPTEPKKELLIILLYSCKTSEVVKTRLPKTISKHLNFAKLKVIFQTSNKLKDYFFFKYFVLETLWSNSIYKFLWEAAQLIYWENLQILQSKSLERQLILTGVITVLSIPYTIISF